MFKIKKNSNNTGSFKNVERRKGKNSIKVKNIFACFLLFFVYLLILAQILHINNFRHKNHTVQCSDQPTIQRDKIQQIQGKGPVPASAVHLCALLGVINLSLGFGFSSVPGIVLQF